MRLGVVGLEGDRLAICGHRLVQLALVLQRIAEVGVGLGVVRLEADRLAICGDRLVELALVLERIAEVVMGLGVVRLEGRSPGDMRRSPRRACPGP